MTTQDIKQTSHTIDGLNGINGSTRHHNSGENFSKASKASKALPQEPHYHNRTQENYIKAIFQLAVYSDHYQSPPSSTAPTRQAKKTVKNPAKNSIQAPIETPIKGSIEVPVKDAIMEALIESPVYPYIHPFQLAEKLRVNVSAVYMMLKKLERQQWVTYQPYKGVRLTEKGRILAINLLRRHRLWESFLQSKLGFDWSEVHPLAEELEHIGNEALIERLEKFLNFPTADPHGDPIPDREGRVNERVQRHVKLSELAIGQSGRLTRVLESSHEFLQYLKEINLILGTAVTMDAQSTFDASYRVTIGKKKRIYLSMKAAHSLFVEKIS